MPPTFIVKTQNFFRAKPTRIIIALIVIAAIMVGISLGIIALTKALTDKCANHPGSDWNSDLKKCIPRSCSDGGHVCKSKNAADDKSGNCIPKDFCSTPEGNYIYDPDSCECTLNHCDSGFEPYTKDGKTFTNDTVNKPMQCGFSCPQIKESVGIAYGGIGYCDENTLCGYNQVKNSDKIHNCYDPKHYKYCDKSTSDLICPLKKNTNKPDCNSNKTFCNSIPPCKEKVLCSTNNDCKGDGNSCIISDIFSQKEFQTIKGTCKDSSFINNLNPRCISTSLDEIGEGCDGTPIDCSANKDKSTHGISNQVQQCKSFITEGKPISTPSSKILSSQNSNCKDSSLACAYKICSGNKTQAIYSDMEEGSVCEQTINACSSTPSGPCYMTNCCEYPFVDTDGTTKCCQESTTNNKSCMLKTLYPIDAGSLTPISTTKSVPLGTPLTKDNINNYNYSNIPKQLSTLAGNPTAKDISIVSNQEGSYYEECGHNYQYQDSGYLSQNIKIGKNPYTSICIKKNKDNCTKPANNAWPGNTFTPLNTPLCKDSEGNSYWSGYDPMNPGKPNIPPVSAIEKTTYNKCETFPYNAIEKLASDTPGLTDISISADVNKNYTVNSTYNCENMMVSVGDSGKQVSWAELGKTNPSSNFEHPEVTTAILNSPYKFSAPASGCESNSCIPPAAVKINSDWGTRYVDESLTEKTIQKMSLTQCAPDSNVCNSSTDICNNIIYPSNKFDKTLTNFYNVNQCGKPII